MIIKRKHETYGMLLSDEKTKKNMYEIMRKYNLTDQQIKDKFSYIWWTRFEMTEMGAGISGDAYREMKNAFASLDSTDPFDNHLTYSDVTKVLTFPSRKGNAVMQWLIRGANSDLGDEIVQIVAFEKNGNYIKAIEPWELNTDISI